MKLPVKVDLAEGADGLELHEIIFSLQYTANAIRPFDLFRARYLEKLVRKYSQIQGQRRQLLEQHFRERFADQTD